MRFGLAHGTSDRQADSNCRQSEVGEPVGLPQGFPMSYDNGRAESPPSPTRELDMRNQHGYQQLSRRRFLSASLLAGGAGLALPDVLRLRALAADQGKAVADTAVIQIWLGGGPSQFETFDPKP